MQVRVLPEEPEYIKTVDFRPSFFIIFCRAGLEPADYVFIRSSWNLESCIISAMSYFVYVLINPENKIYIGQTNDLDRRLSEHNEPEFEGTLHTNRHTGPWKIIYKEEFLSR
ncbi:MAG: GIY-YIG nuclease family protein [Synergistales bacterium]|nr:GIY-YIG nuclease family protein [Synergistales bacterium]